MPVKGVAPGTMVGVLAVMMGELGEEVMKKEGVVGVAEALNLMREVEGVS